MYRTLVDVGALAARLHDPTWIVLDCRFDLGKPSWGETAYATGHIENARYLHLERDLSSPATASTGRHPLPDPDAFAARAGALGVGPGTQVVVYDQGNGMYAARAWWVLRWLGHADVAVLSGGLAAWTAAGHALSTATPAITPRTFRAAPDAAQWVDVTQLQRELARGDTRLFDARGADRYAGQNESIDPVAGHVPGAVNHPFTKNLDASGQLLPVATLREQFAKTLAGHSPARSIAMCGSGVSACLNLLALEHAGLPGARLYPGSWSEWIRDPSRPIETGLGPAT